MMMLLRLLKMRDTPFKYAEDYKMILLVGVEVVAPQGGKLIDVVEDSRDIFLRIRGFIAMSA